MGDGRFVDEIYVEDEEEGTELANDESRRGARMLGCGTIALLFVLFLVAAWALLSLAGS